MNCETNYISLTSSRRLALFMPLFFLTIVFYSQLRSITIRKKVEVMVFCVFQNMSSEFNHLNDGLKVCFNLLLGKHHSLNLGNLNDTFNRVEVAAVADFKK